MRFNALLPLILCMACAARPAAPGPYLPAWKAESSPDASKPVEDAAPPDAMVLAIGDGYFLTFAFWLPGPHGNHLTEDPAIMLHDGAAWRAAEIVDYDPVSRLALVLTKDARAVPAVIASGSGKARLAAGYLEERAKAPRFVRIGADGCGKETSPGTRAFQIECRFDASLRTGVVLLDGDGRVVGFGHVMERRLLAVSPETMRGFITGYFDSWGRHAARKPAL